MNGKKENIDKLEDDFQEENSKETIKNYYYKVSLPTLKLTKKSMVLFFMRLTPIIIPNISMIDILSNTLMVIFM